jgi:hypothetical protein
MSNPERPHWEAVKWILRYLRGTTNTKIYFVAKEPELIVYSYLDMAGDVDGRKSTSGYLVNHSGGALAWQSKLQKCAALNTTEVEFIVITKAGNEILWLKDWLASSDLSNTSMCCFVITKVAST